jgi:hypothetical protein
LLLISWSRIHIPETDATLELPNFRFVAVIGSTQLLKIELEEFRGNDGRPPARRKRSPISGVRVNPTRG